MDKNENAITDEMVYEHCKDCFLYGTCKNSSARPAVVRMGCKSIIDKYSMRNKYDTTSIILLGRFIHEFTHQNLPVLKEVIDTMNENYMNSIVVPFDVIMLLTDIVESLEKEIGGNAITKDSIKINKEEN